MKKSFLFAWISIFIALFLIFGACSSSGGGGSDAAGSSIAQNQDAPTPTSLEVLLIRRGGHPFLGKWALPGGFGEPNETLDQTAKRELEEETGVKGIALEQLATFSTPGRDPRGWTVTGAYIATSTQDKIDVKAGDDAAEASWFQVSLEHAEDDSFKLKLESTAETLEASFCLEGKNQRPRASSSNLAFDHAEIIATALISHTLKEFMKNAGSLAQENGLIELFGACDRISSGDQI